MLDWLKRNEHTLIAAGAITGTVLATVAANTTGLIPQTAGAWLAAAGAVILGVLSHVAIPPVAAKLRARRLARKGN